MVGSKSSNDIDDIVAAFLVEAYPSRTKAAEDRRAEWAEILEFSPKGFKFDTPGVSAFRRRLTVLARGVAADIVVHEACRASSMRAAIAGTPLERIVAYHADTVALGGLAARAGVGHLVLTHLIPAPSSPEHEAAFERDIRSGGYDGPVTVGRDLITITV